MEDSQDPIVVVGLSCRLPGDASSTEKFWDMLVQGRSAWSEPPADRFSLEGYWHPSSDRQGTSSTKHAYFLNSDVAAFDAPFFSMTSTEAAGTDPQQRLLMEVSYEAFENAGIPIKDVVGSTTACYIGCFNEDYRGIQAVQVFNQSQYLTTGNGNAMLSNRISWFYDLRGPSIMIDTACSSSMVALHLACQSLKSGESSMALAGGVNLMLNPDVFSGMSRLRFLSPDGMSHSFDARANGYARGEGVGVLILKRLSDALKNEDTIRAIIRGTAINQDGKTPSITVPSATAQADLIRETYKRAGLPLHETTYFEAHGTGTPQGDFNEMSALGEVFGTDVKRTTPLLVGSVKTSIGHGEGVAGANGLIKSILMLERGIVPPLVGFETLNPRIKLDEWGLHLPLTTQPWPTTGLRRISINSFGYGGTNGHAILDDAAHYLAERGILANHNTTVLGDDSQSEQDSGFSSGDDDSSFDGKPAAVQAPRILVFSSPEQNGFRKAAKKLHEHFFSTISSKEIETDDVDVDTDADAKSEVRRDYARQDFIDLVHTLNHRRSKFDWRSFVIADSMSELETKLRTDLPKYKRAQSQPNCAFVFNGQGAQWYAMGRELFFYPTFARTIDKADEILDRLGATWSITAELGRNKDTSKVNDPALSQPLCTVLQLALVNLVREWGLKPAYAVGHSSGEIAAAYTCGAISFEDAITVAYYRGLYSASLQKTNSNLKGAMLATALSATAAQEIIDSNNISNVCVACVNSPESVTLSGDENAVAAVEAVLSSNGTWYRRLMVNIAYHSHHMKIIAEQYRASIKHICTHSTPSETTMYSSVTGKAIMSSDLGADYWVTNLLSRVDFAGAMQTLMEQSSKRRKGRSTKKINSILEIGPSNALQGPLRQILLAAGEKTERSVTYASILRRDQNASATALEALATLWTTGLDVNLEKANCFSSEELPKALPSLPTYPWNHSRTYWHEYRGSKIHRHRKLPRTDLLGAQGGNFSRHEPQWQNFLRPIEFPWVLDHKIQGVVLFPAAAMLAMAIEAAQVVADERKTLVGIKMRDLIFSQALVFHSADALVETWFQMRPHRAGTRSNLSRGFSFRLTSFDAENNANEHFSGFLDLIYESSTEEVELEKESELGWQHRLALYKSMKESCKNFLDENVLYDGLDKAGMQFGPMFRTLKNIHTGLDTGVASVMIPDTDSVMPLQHQYPQLVHSVVLDGIIQCILTTVIESNPELSANVPTFIESLYISTTEFPNEPGTLLPAYSGSKPRGLKETIGFVTVADETLSRPLILIEGLICTKLTDSVFESSQNSRNCCDIDWIEDVAYLDSSSSASLEASNQHLRIDLEARNELLDHAAAIYIRRTALALSEQPQPRDLTTGRQYRNWLREQRQYTARMNGRLGPVLAKYKGPDEDFLIHSAAEASIAGNIMRNVGENLPAILAGQIDAKTLLDEPGVVDSFIQNITPRPIILASLTALLSKAGNKLPDQHILEVAEGSQTLAKLVIDELSGKGGQPTRLASYTICSINPSEGQEDPVAPDDPLINRVKLNPDIAFEEQGLSSQYYDVIVWDTNLADQPKIETTLPILRKLLKWSGKLVVLSISQIQPRLTLLLGLREEWWLRQPPMKEADWNIKLQAEGFSGVDLMLHDFEDIEQRQMSMMVTTSVPQNVFDSVPQKVVLLKAESSSGQLDNLIRIVSKKISSLGFEVEIHTLRSAPEPKDRIFVSLVDLDMDGQFLSQLDETTYELVKSLCLHSAGLLWLTAGGVAGKVTNPFAGIFTGLLRSVKSENPHLRLCQLDLAESLKDALSSKSLTTTTSSILRIFETSFGSSEAIADAEFALKGDIICVPRVRRHREATNLLSNRGKAPQPTICPLYQEGRPLALKMTTPGLLDTLHFDDYPEDRGIDLWPHQVDIRMQAAGLNFMDVMGAMGQMPELKLGTEGAGIVTRIGSAVTLHKPGDLVFGLVMDSMSTDVITDEELVHAIPPHMTLAEATACPTSTMTAYFALVQEANLRADETILIHAAAGGLGQAAIQIAQWIGAKIFVTVGSEAKKQLVMERYGIEEAHIFNSRKLNFAAGVLRLTEGEGVDVILNSLSGEALKQSWSCIAPFGRFIEVGKADTFQNTGLDMSPFIKHVSFHGVNLELLSGNKKRWRFSEPARKVFALLDQGVIKPAYPINEYAFADVEKAFRHMQTGKHMGKIILRAEPDEKVPAIPRDAHPLVLDDNATYVLSGGLGGIGRSLAKLLVSNGARHLLFLARPSAIADAQEYLDNLRTEHNVDARVAICDISDESQLSMALQEHTKQMPPIKGLIQCAMVLRDCVFENMKFDDWAKSIAPKIHGSWNLHRLLPDDLDFFVLLSSVSGVIGNRGQANYAAGNVFQDQLAAYRHGLGLKATSLDLGAVVDVGFLANNTGEYLEKKFGETEEGDLNNSTANNNEYRAKVMKGLESLQINEADIHSLIKCAITGYINNDTTTPSQMITGLGTGASVIQMNGAVLSLLKKTDINGAGSSDDSADDEALRSAFMKAQTVDQAMKGVENALVARLARALQASPEDIDIELPLYSYGVDSLIAVELRNWMLTRLKSDISVFEILSPMPIKDVVTNVVTRSGLLNATLKAQLGNGANEDEADNENKQNGDAGEGGKQIEVNGDAETKSKISVLETVTEIHPDSLGADIGVMV